VLKRRLIPCLLLKAGRCIKTIRFDSIRDVGNPITAARVYDAQGADELIFLDITASHEGRDTLFDLVAQTAEQCFMPLTVGGGVRTVADIRKLLQAGADKVSINTAAVENPAFIREAAGAFGSQCIVVSIDARTQAPGRYEVFTYRATKPTGLDPVDWARHMADFGAGELLITAVDRDGAMEGYDLELIQSVADAVTVPVIASGGCGTLQHLVEGITLGHASAVAAGSLFHFTDQSVIKAKSYMKSAGLDVRPA
jgi:imidazole glycerol-phosphate synthase subunit HisF